MDESFYNTGKGIEVRHTFNFIEKNLLEGKILVVVPELYKDIIEMCKMVNMRKEAIKNIHKAEFIPIVASRPEEI